MSVDKFEAANIDKFVIGQKIVSVDLGGTGWCSLTLENGAILNIKLDWLSHSDAEISFDVDEPKNEG